MRLLPRLNDLTCNDRSADVLRGDAGMVFCRDLAELAAKDVVRVDRVPRGTAVGIVCPIAGETRDDYARNDLDVQTNWHSVNRERANLDVVAPVFHGALCLS